MGREIVLFKSEEKKSSNEIASILRTVADKVEQGTMTLGQNENRITLDFPKSMVLEIKVEEEEKANIKRSLEIELEWVVGAEEQGSLVID
jgi:amphi-Trp domain-containing protein